MERRREGRRSRARKIRVEQGFEGNGGDENEGRKSWERERELEDLVAREGAAAGGSLNFEQEEVDEKERLMRRSWSGFSHPAGDGGPSLGGGEGGEQVRRRTNSRLGRHSDDQLDVSTFFLSIL